VDLDSNSSWGGGNYHMASDFASNLVVDMNGNNVGCSTMEWNDRNPPYAVYLGPSATGGCAGHNTVIPAVSLPATDTLPFADTAATNLNATGISGSGYTYTASNRTLVIAASGSVILQPGDYNFCKVEIANGGALAAATGMNNRVRIWVDSAARTASGCSTSPAITNAGMFLAPVSGTANKTKLNAGNTTTGNNLEIYVYGTSPASPPPPAGATCPTDFRYYADSATDTPNLFVYAPNSRIDIRTTKSINGRFSGCEVFYFADAPPGNFTASTDDFVPFGRFGEVPGSWRECQINGYTGNVESAGCTG
jgi:hypothetical protein